MTSSAPKSYWETEVLTATPEKRQLMLIEGAIRFLGRTRLLWQSAEDEKASESLIRAQKIVAHLLAGLDSRVDPQLTAKVASVYLFVFRTLVEAGVNHDHQRLDGAIKVLEVERDTWRQLCKELGTSGKAADGSVLLLHQGGSPIEPRGLPILGAGPLPAGDSELSLEV